MDDTYYPRRHHHDGYTHSTRPQSTRYRRASEYGYRRPVQPRIIANSTYFSSQYMGPVLVALLVILLFHRKDGIRRAFAATRERGVLNSIMDLILEMHDYVVAYSQMLLEFLRNIRFNFMAYGDDWFLTSSPAASPHSLRGRRRNATMQGASGMGGGAMPELEEIDINKQQREAREMREMLQFMGKENTDPVEPAFLRDEDYPPGWLVYDPVLGVVSKGEADKHKEEQRKKRFQKEKKQQSKQQQEQQRAKAQLVSKSPTGLPEQSPQSQSQQQSSQQTSSVNRTASRPLRANNVVSNASPMQIAANG